MRRSPALPAVLAAALLFAGPIGLARAAGITYSLVNDTGSPLTEADFTVAPSGILGGPPVTIINPIPSVFNFAPVSQGGHPLQVLLGAPPNPSIKFDGLVFSFVSTDPSKYNTQPLPSGDALDFTLNTVSGFNGTPALSLYNPPKGLSLQVIDPSKSGTSTPDVKPQKNPPPQNTPEPLSVVLWSTLAGASLIRARKLRRVARMG